MKNRLLLPCCLGIVLFALALGSPTSTFAIESESQSSGPSTEQLLSALSTPTLEVSEARRVGALRLRLGLAEFVIEDGWIFPTRAVAGQVREFVFVGKARVRLEPPDAVEREQLELFTGVESLDELVTSAVLVIAPGAAAAALLKLPKAAEVSEEEIRTAQERFDRWSGSGERQQLGVDTALLGAAISDPVHRGYFAAWFRSEGLGDFLYLNEPRSYEQYTLGQFVPLDATEKQKRRLRKRVNKLQRRGRLLGVEVDTLGQFDTWVSASNTAADGSAVRGGSCFAASHYDITLEILPRTLELEGRVKVHSAAKIEGCRLVRLALNRDLVASSVSSDGEELFFRQDGGELFVVLPDAPSAGKTFVLEIAYRGELLEEYRAARVLSDTQTWYPNAGTEDWATYDARFTWPKRYELVASGIEQERGESGDSRWMHKKLELPSLLFTFELGRYKLHRRTVGEIQFTAAIDTASKQVVMDPEEILDAAEQTVEYFSEIFGPYPHSELTLATAVRGFSQSSPALVTLSTLGVSDYYSWAVSNRDPRALIAHEIAHQWWGHIIGMASYRDVWISEALANYAAILFARNELENYSLGPTRGWKEKLLESTPNGRTLESIGPMVLGTRLESSFVRDAYSPIVYTKGAVVLDMLARSYGEETFVQILAALLRAVPQQSLSTEQFLDLVERVTGTDLDAFAEQFIFGTGLPNIYYDFTFEELASGGWKITGEARQDSAYQFSYSVVDRGGGKLGVERTVEDRMEVAESRLFVPIQVAVFDPDHEGGNDVDPEVRGNRVEVFQGVVSGELTPFELTVEHEPKQIWLDVGGQVYGRFFNRRRAPKRVLYYEAFNLAAEHRFDDAETMYRRALEAEVEVGPGLFRRTTSSALSGERTDFRIYRSLADLFLDQGKTRSADEAFESARRIARDWGEEDDWIGSFRTRIVEARLALQKGNPQRAYDLLRNRILKDRWNSRRGELVLAIAAQQLGKQGDLETLLKRAKEKDVDVGLLERK